MTSFTGAFGNMSSKWMTLSRSLKTDKVKALKAQLKFRQNVLHQKPTDLKSVYAFTKAIGRHRINMNCRELTENLKKLVQHYFVLEATQRARARARAREREREREREQTRLPLL